MRRTLPALLLLLPTLATAQDPNDRAVRMGATFDFVADLSDRQPLGPDSARFVIRGLELSASGAIGAGWWGALHGVVGERGSAQLLEGYAARSFAGMARVAAGRSLIAGPVGNAVHLHDLATVERSLGERVLLAPTGLATSGIVGGAAMRGFGLFIAADAGIGERFLEDSASLRPIERPNRLLGGLAYSGRLLLARSVGATTVAATAFGLTSRRQQPLSASAPFNGTRVNAIVARQSVVGGAIVVRGRSAIAPLTAGAHATGAVDSWASVWDDAPWTVSAQAMSQLNERAEDVADRIPADPAAGGPTYLGPTRDYAALAALARARLGHSLDVAARFDYVEDPTADATERDAVSATLGWRWGEQGRVAAGVETMSHDEGGRTWRLLLNAVFTLGRHGALP